MIDVKQIKIADFDYPLPDDRIARHPLPVRDECRLLVSLPDGDILHRRFVDLPGFLPAGSLLICNDTRVINARIAFHKSTGSRIEVFLLEPLSPADYLLMFQARGHCRWSCMVGNLKRWKENPLSKELEIDGKKVLLEAFRHEPRPGNSHEIEFRWDNPDITFASIVDAAGYIPIPPYLRRDSEATDADDYQTVYARFKGSVAAPTAGLHFTDRVFSLLREKGITTLPLTLHVGAGTFQPVKSEEIGDHPMHTETFSVTRALIESLIKAKRDGRQITAIGTTSVRTLESLPYLGAAIARGDRSLFVGQWWPYEGDYFPNTGKGEEESIVVKENTIDALKAILDYMKQNNLPTLTAATSIMIAPGFEWRIVDAMVTNFHQPQSTLLLLVSSFLSSHGSRNWQAIYDEALSPSHTPLYRFLSYGDACLFL